MLNDIKLQISSARSRKATNWLPQTIWWSEFVEKLRNPIRSTESLAEYLSYSKPKQDELKDVGGFVLGVLKANRRKAGNVVNRYAVALDLDNIPAGQTQEVLKKIEALGCAYVVYSTRKHSGDKPRLRVIILLDRPCTADEYEPLSRMLGKIIGIELCDPTTFEASRLMYWPSCCSDSQYEFQNGDKPSVNVDGVLAMYKDWRNVSEWPQVPGEQQKHIKLAAKQGEPTEKSGIVGAFNKSYNIYQAIDKFIPDAYTHCDNASDRLTFTGGSTAGGAVVYSSEKSESAFLFSHHGTDPAGGKLCNAFDLVRLHKFNDLDDEAKPETHVTSLPSFIAMANLAKDDEEVWNLFEQEKYQNAAQDFGQLIEEAGNTDKKKPSTSWLIKDVGKNGITCKINETIFVNEMQRTKCRYYVHGKMYDSDGLIPDGTITKEIQKIIEPWVTQGQARKVQDLYKALCLKAYYEAPEPRQDEIHFSNVSLRITDQGFVQIEPPSFIVTKIKHSLNWESIEAPKWFGFLSCLLHPEDMITVQEYLGYCFLATTKAQKALFIKSGGGEGKSILGTILKKIFNESCIVDKLQSLAENRFKLATLENKLVFLDDDLNTAGLVDTGTWKSVVTNKGKMSVEEKGKDTREANIFIRYFCIGNEDVTSLFDHSDAFYDRIIPLTTRGIKWRDMPGENVNLTEEIVEEIPAIITWAMWGLLRLYKNGYKFTISEAASSNLKNIKSSNNSVVAFLNSDYLEFGSGYTCFTSVIVESYKMWCQKNGEEPKKGFPRALKQALSDINKTVKYNDQLILDGRRGRGYVGVQLSSIGMPFTYHPI